jgi:hypothetical protein
MFFYGCLWFGMVSIVIWTDSDRFGLSFSSYRPFWTLFVTFWLIGLLGWGTTRRELKVPSGIAPKIKGDCQKLLSQRKNATVFFTASKD